MWLELCVGSSFLCCLSYVDMSMRSYRERIPDGSMLRLLSLFVEIVSAPCVVNASRGSLDVVEVLTSNSYLVMPSFLFWTVCSGCSCYKPCGDVHCTVYMYIYYDVCLYVCLF